MNVQGRKLSREKGGLDKQRQKTDQRKSGGVAGVFYRKAVSYVYVFKGDLVIIAHL